MINLRHVSLLAAFIISCTTVSSQTNFIKNPGFETWSGNLPTSWVTDTASCTKSTVVKSGSAALKLKSSLLMGMFPVAGLIMQTCPVSGSTFTLKGWCQLKPINGDGVIINVAMSKGNNWVGGSAKEFYQAQSAYTAFAMGIEMVPGTTADSCHILLSNTIDSFHTDVNPGAYVLFDDLVLDNTVTGAARNSFVQPSEFSLGQNFPNPFNPSTTIEFSIPKDLHVTLTIYNTMGQQLAVLIDEQMPQGRYRKTFDAVQWSSGVYLYELQAGSFTETKRMTLVR